MFSVVPACSFSNWFQRVVNVDVNLHGVLSHRACNKVKITDDSQFDGENDEPVCRLSC